MFSRLLKSEARKSLLAIFLNESRQKYYLRELAERIKYSPGSLQRELNSLVESDLLLSEKIGNLRFFSLNTKSTLLKELRQYLARVATYPSVITPASSRAKAISTTSSVISSSPTTKLLGPKKAPQAAPSAPQFPTPPHTQPTTQSSIHPPTHPTIQTPIHSKTQYSSLEKPEIKKPIFAKPNLSIPVNRPDYLNQKSPPLTPPSSTSSSSLSVSPSFTYTPTPQDLDIPPDDITLHIE